MTLDSPRAWSRTHRLGGHLFFWYGVTLVITAFLLDSFWQVAPLIGGSVAITLIMVGYAWWAWRTDPDRA